MDALEPHIKKERERARELRRSRWWANRVADAVCYYCGKAVSKGAATMDHVVPVAQGGHSTPGNVVVACKPCNTRKRDMTAVEWALEQESCTRRPDLD